MHSHSPLSTHSQTQSEKSAPLSRVPALYISCKDGALNENRKQFWKFSQKYRDAVDKFCSEIADSSARLLCQYPEASFGVRVLWNKYDKNQKRKSPSPSPNPSPTLQNRQSMTDTSSDWPIYGESPGQSPSSKKRPSKEVRFSRKRNDEKPQMTSQKQVQKKIHETEEEEEITGRSILEDPIVKKRIWSFRTAPETSWLETDDLPSEEKDQRRRNGEDEENQKLERPRKVVKKKNWKQENWKQGNFYKERRPWQKDDRS